jgi:hypothetical protein
MVSMKKGELYTVGVHFTIDNELPPPRSVIHEALEALRAFDIEAPNNEVAEHYADVIMKALLKAADTD